MGLFLNENRGLIKVVGLKHDRQRHSKTSQTLKVHRHLLKKLGGIVCSPGKIQNGPRSTWKPEIAPHSDRYYCPIMGSLGRALALPRSGLCQEMYQQIIPLVPDLLSPS